MRMERLRRAGWHGSRRCQVKANAANQAGVFIGFSGMTYQAARLIDHQQFVILKEDVKKVLHNQLLFKDDRQFRKRYASDYHKNATMNNRKTHIYHTLSFALS